MQLMVDLSKATVTLADRDEMRQFSCHVSNVGAARDHAAQRIAGVLQTVGLSAVPSETELLVTPESVIRLAEVAADHEMSALSPSWYSAFDAMVAFAATKGWTDGDGRIRVHIDWQH